MRHVTTGLVAVLLVLSVARSQSQPSAVNQTPSANLSQRDLLEKYCINCHSNTRKYRGFVLEPADVDNVPAHAVAWEKVVLRMRAGLMPPPGMPRPDRATVDVFLRTVEAALDRDNASNWLPPIAEPLSDAALASRVSKFLWDADPDAGLLQAAARGGLKNPAVLEREVRRMLADSKATATFTGYLGAWLGVQGPDPRWTPWGDILSRAKPSPAWFPEFDSDLRQSFVHETQLFLESQIRDDRPVTELWTANYTFLNERLARHYGIANVSGPAFRRVTWPDDARAGLTGQGSILTVTSFETRTSPVRRGKWLLEHLFGIPPPAPPGGLLPLKEDAVGKPTSVRKRMEEQYGRNGACVTCHAMFVPMGFAFDNFDAIGRWRDAEGATPVDASGTLPDGTSFNGPAEFRTGVLQHRDAIVRTLTERLFAYALGREIELDDMPAIRVIVTQATSGDDRWSSLILGIVKSRPFQSKRVMP